MMAKDRVVSADKLVEVKREFGFPNDFLVRLVSMYPEYFRLHGAPGEGKSFLELVSWTDEFAKSIIEKRADEESSLTGIRVRPEFNWKQPVVFVLKKEMRGLVRSSKNMDGAIIGLKLPLFAVVLLVLYPMTKGQWALVNPPPLCASQFALVNHACFKLPYMPVPPPSSPSPPLPPPNPPSPDGSGSPHHSSHGHRHRHRHKHRGHRHRETPIEEECCRWLKEVDSVCICELLVHLPLFLIKPVHNYSVTVDETCSVTFQCRSSLLPV